MLIMKTFQANVHLSIIYQHLSKTGYQGDGEYTSIIEQR